MGRLLKVTKPVITAAMTLGWKWCYEENYHTTPQAMATLLNRACWQHRGWNLSFRATLWICNSLGLGNAIH